MRYGKRTGGNCARWGAEDKEGRLYLGALCGNGRAAVCDGDSVHHLGAGLVAPRKLARVNFPHENRKGVNVDLLGDGFVAQHLWRLIRRGAGRVGDGGNVPVRVIRRETAHSQ